MMSEDPRIGDLLLDWEDAALEGRNLTAEELCPEDPVLREKLRAAISRLQAMNQKLGKWAPEGHSSDYETQSGLLESETLSSSHPSARTASLPLSSHFADYELREELARGGMGVVYRARQISLNRIVALKMILTGQLAGPHEIQRFRTEAEAAARLDHPGIVPIYEVGEFDNRHFFSMGYVAGESLAQRVARGPLPQREAAELVRQVAEAVSYAHSRGVIHRDLKPGNVLIDLRGRPRVTDFGLAKTVEGNSELTASGQILGTPSYMPPEQARGSLEEVGPWSDVYSLGALLYCLLTGRPPFQGSTVIQTLNQVIDRDPVPVRALNPAVDRDLETVCLKCLRKPPQDRVPSASELAAELGRYLAGESVNSRPLSRPVRIWRWMRRKPWAVPVSVLLLVLMVLLFRHQREVARAERIHQIGELTRALDQGINDRRFGREYLPQMELLLYELNFLEPELTTQYRQRVYQDYAGDIEHWLGKARIAETDYFVLEAAIDQLQLRDPQRAHLLRGWLKSRRGGWNPLLSWTLGEEPSPLFKSFGANRFRRLSNGELQRTEPGPASLQLLMDLVPRGSSLIRAVFGSGWQDAERVGICLNASAESSGYEIAVESSPAENTPLLVLRKQGAILIRSPLPEQVLQQTRLSLTVIQQGGHLRVFSHERLLQEFDDPFPPSMEAGHPGILLPAEVPLQALKIALREISPGQTLETADDLFARGKYAEALQVYQTREQQALDRETRQETYYKTGLCLMELNRGEEGLARLQLLMNESGDRWPLLAGAQLWRAALQREDLMEAEFSSKVLQSRLTLPQLVSLLPQEERHQFLKLYLNRFHTWEAVVSENPVPWIERLQKLAEVDMWLREQSEPQPHLQVALATAYLRAGKQSRALELLQPMLQKLNHPEPGGEEAWFAPLMLMFQILPPEEGRALLEQGLLGLGTEASPQRGALLMIQARWLARDGNIEQAIQVASQATEMLRSPAPQFAEIALRTWLLRGVLEAERQQFESAVTCWKEGFQLARLLNSDETSESHLLGLMIQLGSLSGELTIEDAAWMQSSRLKDQDRLLGELAAQIPLNDLDLILREMWRSERARNLITAIARGELSEKEEIQRFAVLLIQSWFRSTALNPFLPPQEEELLWQLSEGLWEEFLSDPEQSRLHLRQWMHIWKGLPGPGSGKLPEMESLKPEHRMGLGSLLGFRLLRLGHPAQALELWKSTLATSLPDSPWKNWLQTSVDLVQRERGRLRLAASDESMPSIEILQDTRVITTLTFPEALENDLPPGVYQLNLPLPESGWRLVTNQLELSIGQQVLVPLVRGGSPLKTAPP